MGFFLWGDINVIFVIEKTMCCGETPQNMQHERNTLAFAGSQKKFIVLK